MTSQSHFSRSGGSGDGGFDNISWFIGISNCFLTCCSCNNDKRDDRERGGGGGSNSHYSYKTTPSSNYKKKNTATSSIFMDSTDDDINHNDDDEDDTYDTNDINTLDTENIYITLVSINECGVKDTTSRTILFREIDRLIDNSFVERRIKDELRLFYRLIDNKEREDKRDKINDMIINSSKRRIATILDGEEGMYRYCLFTFDLEQFSVLCNIK